MRTLILSLVLMVLPTATALAQTATPGSRLGWTQEAGSLAIAQGYTYEASYDGSALFAVVQNVVCAAGAAANEFSCAGDFQPVTPTEHTVALRAVSVAGGQRLESPLSATFTFTFVALPVAPRQLRVVPPGA